MGGVGAVALAVPPVAVVYHFKPEPVAVNGPAGDPKHKVIKKPTVGAEGVA